MGSDAVEETKRQAQQQGKRAAKAASPWVESLARLGYAARGVVYIVIGLLAFRAANGAGSPNVNNQQALQTIFSQPFGQIMLAIITVGLVGYALWRLILAIADPEGEGNDTKGIVKRAGYALAGLSYGALAFVAWKVMTGANAGSGSPKDITARAMALPLGRWLVGLAGLAIVAAGLYLIYQAYQSKFEKQLKSGELNAQQKRWAIGLGKAGYAAKGLVYVVIGIFLVQAALTYDPNKAGGLGDALQALAAQPYGSLVLAATALGLLAYGLYSLALALFRRIQLR